MNIKVSMFHVLGRRRIWLPGRLLAGTVLLVPLVIAAVLPMDYLPFDPFESVAEPFTAPSFEHPFGVDDLGRDLFSAILAGSQTSLTMGLAVAGLAMFIGVTIGVIAGFFGGYLDDVLMRLTELVQSVPRFFIAILMGAFFGGSFTTLVLVLGLTSWPGLARITRAAALSLKSREFVTASFALGGESYWVLTRHVLPNARLPVMAAVALIITSAILTEAGLSYLGISDPNVVSWGQLIDNAQSFLHLAWWLSVFPGLAIMIMVLGITLVADGLSTD